MAVPNPMRLAPIKVPTIITTEFEIPEEKEIIEPSLLPTGVFMHFISIATNGPDASHFLGVDKQIQLFLSMHIIFPPFIFNDMYKNVREKGY
ncbi:hypothetical protein [Lysinibacillus fusiformis]